MKRVTMADVAKQAGVSKSTVSHVINETRFVEESTRQRVQQVVEELNYRPSSIARSLVSKRTKTAGLLISDVGNPFYHQVILGVEDVALAHDYSVFLFNASYDPARSLKYIYSMVDKSVDGAMFMSSRISHELVQELLKNQIPIVVLDWEQIEFDGIALISVEFEIGIRQAVDHLITLGHQRFAHVSGPQDLWTSRARHSAYVRSLQVHGVAGDQIITVEGDLMIDGGRRALARLLEKSPRPTAVFAANDLTAFGVIWEARARGLRVPEDLSVIGLDDIALASQFAPALTTVALPCYEIGRLAMEMLLEMLAASEASWPVTERLQSQVATSLVVRQSTGPVGR